MDKLSHYCSCIRNILHRYETHVPCYGEIEIQLIEDTEHDHYQVYTVGWHNNRRIHGCTLHIDIKDGKIWIQHNGTEDRIAEELVDSGVPKEDIVLGFHAPYRRQFTDYAVN
jgi:hypothetical protein